jgi:Ca2+-binding EF-hand superfamily protein
MKKSVYLVVLALMVAACGPSPESQELSDRFSEFDRNDNGCVTSGEYYAAGGSKLMYGIFSSAAKQYDKNSDGQVCEDELSPN